MAHRFKGGALTTLMLAAVMAAPLSFCSPCRGSQWISPRTLAKPSASAEAFPPSRSAASIGFAAFALLSAGIRPRRSSRSKQSSTPCHATASAEDNIALVFLKPHAYTPKALDFVPAFLKEKGLEVLHSGQVLAEEVEEKGIIDAHYSAIAKIGMARDMSSLGLGSSEAAKFESGYGRSLDDAIAAGEVCSAVDAMEVLQVDASELLRRCLEAGYEKLRSGLYCARLEGGASELFVLNGFYARMREKFTAPGVVVNWFIVSFQEAKLPWSKFRSEVIGATNPADAVDGSLRARIRDDWQLLGLKEATNYQDNGVHASAGPLEALRERMVWLGEDPQEDPLGQAISEKSAVPLKTLLDNPQLRLGTDDGGPAFDLLEDLGSAATLEALATAKLDV